MLEHLKTIKGRLSEVSIVLIASVIVTGLITGARYGRVFEIFELVAYDRFMQRRPAPTVDDRILVIAITEADLQEQGGRLQLSDDVYAKAIKNLLKYKPRAIGLDIYRDFPFEPGNQAFQDILKSSDRVIGITKIGDENNPPVAPPPALPPEQVGFNDASLDFGGILRRAVLYQDSLSGEVLTSFSLLLAERYLIDDGIESESSPLNPSFLKLGKTTFVPLTTNDGSYVRANMGGYQILLDYKGLQNTIPQVSLGEILSDRVNPAQIRDRVILIGTTAYSGNDFVYTPYSSQGLKNLSIRMPGVVVHAQMVSQFLDAATGVRSPFWFWSDAQEILWFGLWAIMGGVLAWTVRNPLLLALGSTTALALLFHICYTIFLQMGWIPLIPTAMAFLFTGGSVITYSAQQAQQQQKMVMRLLGQSTSPQIAETLWQKRDELLDNGKLPGQKLIATLLFTDLKGFSSVSEKYPPELVFSWLNEYLEEMSDVIQTHHGVINKFTGDGIMAVFGVPIPHLLTKEIAEDAQEAASCAVEMSERLSKFNAHRIQQNLPILKMRVGIFTGPVVVGSLGSKIRLEYGVIGDSVNTASRLESLEKHRQDTDCRILIARQTLDHLNHQFNVKSWGTLPLKGKENTVEVFQVLSRKSHDSDANQPLQS